MKRRITKRLLMATVVISCFSLISAGMASAAAQQRGGGNAASPQAASLAYTYYIHVGFHDPANGKAMCLDADSRYFGNGDKVQLFDCNNGTNQQWIASHDSSGRPIWVNRGATIALGRTMCLDADSRYFGNGDQVQIFTCNNGWNQEWSGGTNYSWSEIWVTTRSSYCLDADSTHPGNHDKVQVWSCHTQASPNQLWLLVGA